ncbi:hypothetical protein [Sphingomonas sp. T9W2]|uniref:hypothetical protein n=1 Tax=Sphingomonas sp. T9W2 TaxID=3143183 RepID=UPI0031F537F5
MTDRSKLLALAEAVAASTSQEAEREELGVQVMEALEIASYITDDGDPCLSMDGAVAIVPKGWGWLVSQPNEMAMASGLLKEDTPVMGEVQYGCDQRFTVAAATPALALCAAALRAQAEALS